ncbi:MAG: histidine kinase, partial [Oscillatoria sp. PMC 1050.18]|nr:histidine kinase [Oscillatoria sp. PMC 1050.18]
QAVSSLEKIDPGNPEAIAGLVNVIASTDDKDTRRDAAKSLEKILTIPQQYAGVVSALKDCLSNEVYQNNFDRFDKCYKVVWDCAAILPYPEFYQAWHHPPTTPHPEVTEQTPVGHNSTVDSLETQLQNLPIFCLNAQILATETRESEIAQILCELIWEKALPNELYPEVTTLAQLRRSLKQLKLTLNLPKLNLLLTECKHPTPELIAFCHKLTDTVAISWLTENP